MPCCAPTAAHPGPGAGAAPPGPSCDRAAPVSCAPGSRRAAEPWSPPTPPGTCMRHPHRTPSPPGRGDRGCQGPPSTRGTCRTIGETTPHTTCSLILLAGGPVPGMRSPLSSPSLMWEVVPVPGMGSPLPSPSLMWEVVLSQGWDLPFPAPWPPVSGGWDLCRGVQPLPRPSGGSCPISETLPSPHPLTPTFPLAGDILTPIPRIPSPALAGMSLSPIPAPSPAPDSHGRCPRGGVPVPGPGCSGWVSWRGCRARGRGWGCWAVTMLVAPPVLAVGWGQRGVSSVPPVTPPEHPLSPLNPPDPPWAHTHLLPWMKRGWERLTSGGPSPPSRSPGPPSCSGGSQRLLC